jgi:uncharacterized protein
MIFKTKNNHHYYFNSKQKNWLLLNEIMNDIIQKPQEIESLLACSDDSKIKDYFNQLVGQGISRDELEYYFKKFQFLNDNSFFNTKDKPFAAAEGLKAEDIKYNLANLAQIVFEVTENCNLSCKYCGYGEFYEKGQDREKRNVNIEDAKSLLEYLLSYWESDYNNNFNRGITIGFYGGEPLLNIKFIEEIVKFCKNLPLSNNFFKFNITTNGLLLHKHINYLIENDFNVLISLDGNEANNAFRLTKDNKNPFHIIYATAKSIKNNYPSFFQKRVNFNAVLHSNNSVMEIYSFFKSEFEKIPDISPLNNFGILEEKIEEFNRIYRNYKDNLANDENYQKVEKDMFLSSLNVRDLSDFIHAEVGLNFRNYNAVLNDNFEVRSVPTGTCLPFGRKLYFSANSEILPCERIDHNFTLGKVNNKSIDLNCEKVANIYNSYYQKMYAMCNRCYMQHTCHQCLFYIPGIDTEKPVCYGYYDKNNFSKYIEGMLNEIEHDRSVYQKIVEKVVLE